MNSLATIRPTHEKIPMPTNRKHRAFVRAVAEGMTQTEAYGRYVSSRGAEEHRRKPACVLARRYRPAIHELRSRILAKLDHDSIMSKAEAAQYASRLVRTPVSDVDDQSDLAQEITETTSPDGITRKTIKMGRKLDALGFLSRTLGWEAASQVNHTVTLADSPALRALETVSARVLPSAQRYRQAMETTTVQDAELVKDDSERNFDEIPDKADRFGREYFPTTEDATAQPSPPTAWNDPAELDPAPSQA